MSFKTEIEDLIGSVGDDTLISNAIQDIGSEIVNVLPYEKLMKICKTTSISGSGTNTSTFKVLAVDKSDYFAKEIPSMDKARYKNTGSIYAGSDTSPVYYFENQSIFVIGSASGGETTGTLHYVPRIPTSDGSTAIAHGDTGTEHFPKEAEPLLVTGGAVRCLQRLLADKSANLPTDINEPTLPVSPTSPTLSSNSVTFSQTAPSYVMPLLTLENSRSLISDLTFSAVSPTVPVLTSNSVSFSTTPPAYISPVFSPSFGTVDSFISTDEDVELASIKIQEINSQINDFQANIQNQLNVFNDANTEYQAELQKAIQNAQLSQSDDVQKLQKFSNEIQLYQAQVGKEVQEYQQNTDADIRLWTAERQTDLQKYSNDIQNALNVFNVENTEYQANLQISIQNAQLSSQDDAQLLQKYSSEVQDYQSEISSIVQKYNTDIQNYGAKIQKHTTDYQWKQGQYQMLKAEYNQGLQLLIGGGMPQQQGA